MGVQKHKAKSKHEEPEVEETTVAEAVDTDVDDILAEIDEVLEENAQEFVAGYIQKGGQ